MLSSAENPTEHIFKCHLTPKQDWLGRIVSSCQDPSASCIPSFKSLASLASNVLITTKSDFLLEISATRDPELRTRLSRLLETSSAESDVPTPNITHRRLENPKKILDELISRPEISKELLGMLPLGCEVYIVVGVFDIDGVSLNRLKQSGKTSGGISLPVADVARAAAGFSVTLNGIGNIELSPMETSSSEPLKSSVYEGREIIAMEFRALRKHPKKSRGSDNTVGGGGEELEILEEVFLGCVSGPFVGWDPYTKIKYHFSDKDTE